MQGHIKKGRAIGGERGARRVRKLDKLVILSSYKNKNLIKKIG